MNIDPETAEIERHSRYVRAISNGVVGRARAGVRLEINKKLPEQVLDTYIMKPRSWLKTVMVRISLEKLYRRYKCIRTRTLIEVLQAISKCKDEKEIISTVRQLVVQSCESSQVNETALDDDLTFNIEDFEE